MALVNDLGTLETSGLIRLAAAMPELEYLFRHALVQEAAYASLVKRDRRQLHLAVGDTLERLYPERLDELAPLMGQHFSEGGDEARALKYLTRAGDNAARVYANAEAITHYSGALEIARRSYSPDSALPHGDERGTREIRRLFSRLGMAFELSGRHDEALRHYADMERWGRAHGDRPMEFDAVMERAKIYSTPSPAHDGDKARAELEHALRLTTELGDRAGQARVYWSLMLLNVFGGGGTQQAVDYGEQALAIARELGLTEQLAFILNDLYYAYLGNRQVDRARATQNEARQLWQQLGNLPMLADNLSAQSVTEIVSGNFDDALALADEAYRITRSIGNLWGQTTSRFLVGHAYLERGDFERGIETMETAIALSEQGGMPAPLIATRADLAWAYAQLGRLERALDIGRQARDRGLAGPFKISMAPWAIGVLARLYARSGDLERAGDTLREAHEYLRPQSLIFSRAMVMLADAEIALAGRDWARAVDSVDRLIAHFDQLEQRTFRADALWLKGRALLGSGDADAAHEAFCAARGVAESIGSRRSLWPVLLALSEIEVQRGDAGEAGRLRREARAIVEYIADHTGSAELRESFLAVPEVRDVMKLNS